MAKIPLRAYNREIEGLIDQGQTLEAVAHCQHILKTFPKCLDTYRLLGKAYLELQKFTEAADVFNRLLLAVPEDFIANLGMSIIYDDQKNLDAAIWHMERAFETQSSNPAIQGELRRLYSRRDGMEPPKIRLTRGALAQMYARGDQFQQAVSEIKSVLAEEPQRMDLLVLLARVYFRAGQKVESTEICTSLLKKYPYCLDANRILIEILPGTTRSDATQVYRHRVNALDPYAAFAAPSIFNSAEVADAAVSIEKLAYQADAWAPAKFGLETKKEEAPPEWLSGKEAAPAEAAEAEPASDENIPEWMKTAGWAATTAAVVEAADRASAGEAVTPDTVEMTAVPGEISSGEVPDWLMSIAPPGALEQPAEQPASMEVTSEDINWLESLGAPAETAPAVSQPDENSSMLDEILGVGAAVGAAMALGEKEQQPEGEFPAAPAEETPDWLSELGGQSMDATAVNLPPVGQSSMPATDWLTELESQAADATAVDLPPVAAQPAEDLPDWLTGAGAGAADAGAVSQTLPGGPDSELPDWLKNVSDEFAAEGPVVDRPTSLPGAEEPEFAPAAEVAVQPPASAVDAGLPVSDDDAFAWLESLAAKQGAKPEELLTRPEDRPEETPDWLSQLSESGKPEEPGPGFGGAAIAAGAVAAADALFDKKTPEESVLPDVEDALFVEKMTEPPVSPAAEMDIFAASTVESSEVAPAQAMSDDDAFSWLESLAARQGAKPEELLTRPEDRAESAPEWATQMAAETPQPAGSLIETPVEPADETGADLAWLKSMGSDLPVDESTIGEQPIEENLFTQPAAESIFEEKPVEMGTDAGATLIGAASADEVAEWLNQLDAEDSGLETPAQPAPAAEYTTEELPDWLKEEEPAELPVENLPDWLKVEAVESPAVAEPVKTEWQTEQAPVIESMPAVAPPPVVEEPAFEPVVSAEEPEFEPVLTAEEPVVVSASQADASLMQKVGAMIMEPVPEKPVKVQTAEKDIALYENSKLELQRGNLIEAAQGYKKLIKKGKMLEEVIFDLREAQYSHPVDVVLWQTLGDAYMRANRLQDALDAYTKAEELLR
jgi:tetratricopeptide (TPR) repeat protein